MKTVEQAYQNYLKLSKLDETKMHTVHVTETRRAFFAGFGSCLKALESFSNEMSDEEIVASIEGMHTEVGNYFNAECEKQG